MSTTWIRGSIVSPSGSSISFSSWVHGADTAQTLTDRFISPELDLLSADPVHPNAKGYERMVEMRAFKLIGMVLLVGLLVSWETVAYSAERQAAEDGQPVNLLMISIDTLRPDHLSCYGYHRHTSAAIDSVAERGRILTNVFATAPATPDSHMSIFTSQFPFEHGVGMGSERILSNDTTTLAEVLQHHGYQTAAFVGSTTSDHRFGPAYGFARGFHDWRYRNSFAFPGGEIRQWLEAHQHEPFFLFLHANDTHEPHLLAPGLDARRFDSGYKGPVPGTWDEFIRRTDFPFDWQEVVKELSFNSIDRVSTFYTQLVLHYDAHVPPTAENLPHIVAFYDAQLYYADRGIGMILDTLRELHLDGNTLIVITSDHGQLFGEHGEFGHGDRMWDPVLRVPLIIAGPHVPAGESLPQLASSIDILPTVLDLLKFPVPQTARGISLVPLLQGETSEAQREVVYAQWRDRLVVRTLEWKLVVHEDGRRELYDIVQDPDEQQDVLDQHASVASALSDRLDGAVRHAQQDPLRAEANLRQWMSKETYW